MAWIWHFLSTATVRRGPLVKQAAGSVANSFLIPTDGPLRLMLPAPTGSALSLVMRFDGEAIAGMCRSVRQCPDTLDEAAVGAARETLRKCTSKVDPAAQGTGAHYGRASSGYTDNYLIDVTAAIIVDVEAMRSRPAGRDRGTRTMIKRLELCPSAFR